MEGEETPLRKGRKRVRRRLEWTKNKRKRLRNSGKAYKTSKGSEVPAREMDLTPCGCALKCFDKVNQTQRQKLFDGFWKTEDFDVQNAYLSGCVKVVDVKKRYTDNPSTSRRRHSSVFYVQNGGISARVCKKAFLKIHAISNGRLSRALKAVEVAGGSPHQDQRGRHEPINKTSEEKIDLVKSHIESFPSYTSHYSRSDNPNRKYLSPELNLTKMYLLYKDDCTTKSVDPVSEWVYRKVFNEDFNLSFGYPKTDTCKTCDEFKVRVDAESDSDAKQQLTLEWDVHKINAENAYQCLRQDTAVSKSDPDREMLTFDLEQTLATPQLTTNVVFYKRQMWTYNLGIHDCKTGQGCMHMWHEGTASRGSQEIGSCLLHHLKKMQSQATKLTLYSDSCGGQNRNINLVCMWMHIVSSPEYSFTQIDQKFMLSGHSYLPKDRDFSTIEIAKRRAGVVYVPEEWYKLVRDCRRVNAFHVEEMKQGDFVSLKTLTENIVNRKVTVDKRKVDWLSMRWIRVTQDRPFAFKYRCSLNDLEQWKVVDVKRRQRGRPVDMGRVNLPLLYTQSRPIKKAKLDNLMALLSYVPPVYHSFYESLQDDEAGTDSEAESDFESEEESPEDG